MNIFKLFSSILFAVTVALSSSVDCIADDQLTFGMVAPLSGDFAPYGVHIQKGVELAIADLAKRNIPARLVAEDGCLPAQVRTALTKLTSEDKISALVASYCVIGMVASESILENSKTIGFQTSGGTKEILSSGEYLFTTAAKTSDEAVALADYAYGSLGLRKAGVLYLTTQWGEEFNQAFSNEFRRLGGSITGSATNPIGQNDFRSELIKLRAGEPDSLLIVHLASTLGIAMKQAHDIGLRTRFLATSDAEEASVLKEAGKNAEGLVLLAPEPRVDTPKMKSFEALFETKFGQSPHPLSRHAYDATILAASALKECAGKTECAKGQILQVKNYSGVSGNFSINSDGGTSRTFVAKIVRDGRFVKE